MENLKEQKDLQNFLDKVDNVDSIIRGLTSNDPITQAAAISKADQELASFTSKKSSSTEVAYDQTFINKSAYKSDENLEPTFSEQRTSQEAFLASLEADSQRRAKARKERHQKANMIKEQGNKLYNSGNFEEAVQFYSDAMKVAKDLTTLYTNRAASYIKLQKFDHAISDCDFALQIDDSWIKAYILKAKCLSKLHRYGDALQEYDRVKKMDKDKLKMVEKCIDQMLKEKKQYFLEEQITEKLENEDLKSVNLARLIHILKCQSQKDISNPNDALVYFIGGFQILQSHLVDEESKTLFRTKGGFQMFSDSGFISQSIQARYNNQQIQLHSAKLVTTFLFLCTAACSKMAENVDALIAETNMPDLLLSFFEWPDLSVKSAVILLFKEISSFEITRFVLYDKMNCIKLSSLLLKPGTTKSTVNLNACSTLCNFALDSGYCKQIHKGFNENFTSLLKESLSQIKQLSIEALTMEYSYIIKLLENKELCKCIGKVDSFQNVCVASLGSCSTAFKNGLLNSEITSKLLRILRCILKIKYDVEHCHSIIAFLRPMLLKTKDDDLLLSILQVVSLILELEKSCIECLFSDFGHAIVKSLYNCLMKNVSIRTFSLKILCCAAQVNANYIHSYIKMDKNFEILRNILFSKDPVEEINQGHVALFFSAIATKSKILQPLLNINAEGEIIRKLLVLCRDSKNKQVSANCAIALGKLSVSDEKFLLELRKHDGINILSRLKTKEILS